MGYITNTQIRANGETFKKGETFPKNLKKVDYEELLIKELITESTPVEAPKAKKPRRVAKPKSTPQPEIEQQQQQQLENTENLLDVSN